MWILGLELGFVKVPIGRTISQAHSLGLDFVVFSLENSQFASVVHFYRVLTKTFVSSPTLDQLMLLLVTVLMTGS